jgi:hypothetical protein
MNKITNRIILIIILLLAFNNIEAQNFEKFAKNIMLKDSIPEMTFAIITRKEVSTTVFRAKGTLYTENKQEKTVSNIFNAEFVNKTFTDIDIRLIPKTENLKLKIVDKAIRVPSGDIRKAVLILSMNQENIKENSKPIMIEVYQGEELVDEIETTFLGPVYD